MNYPQDYVALVALLNLSIFSSAREYVFRYRTQYAQNEITKERLLDLLCEQLPRDQEGNYWTMGEAENTWYMLQDDVWTEAKCPYTMQELQEFGAIEEKRRSVLQFDGDLLMMILRHPHFSKNAGSAQTDETRSKLDRAEIRRLAEESVQNMLIQRDIIKANLRRFLQEQF